MHIRSEYAGNGKLRMERRSEVDMLKFSLQINDQNVVKEGSSRRKKNESMDVPWRKQQLLPPGQVMTAKVKGLLKGLRYISQIFEPIEKEPEMQIGYPTDVKHVAHIGCDGPLVSSPAWMNEFRSVPDFSTTPLTTLEALTSKDLPTPIPTTNPSKAYKDSSSRRPEVDSPAAPRPNRRHHSHAAPDPAAGEDQTPAPRRRESRRNQSCGESPEVSRRHRRTQGAGGEGSPGKEADCGGEGGAVGKPSRRRRSKLGGGGSRSLEPNVSDAPSLSASRTVSEGRVDGRLRSENLINN